MKAITVLSAAALSLSALAVPAYAAEPEASSLDGLRLGSLQMLPEAQPSDTFMIAEAMRMSSSSGGSGVNPVLPAVASLVIPGLGQTINNDSPKNIMHFLIAAGIWGGGLGLSYALNNPTLYYITVGVGGVWHILSAYDGYVVAAGR